MYYSGLPSGTDYGNFHLTSRILAEIFGNGTFPCPLISPPIFFVPDDSGGHSHSNRIIRKTGKHHSAGANCYVFPDSQLLGYYSSKSYMCVFLHLYHATEHNTW